jgi:hypothetical protein
MSPGEAQRGRGVTQAGGAANGGGRPASLGTSGYVIVRDERDRWVQTRRIGGPMAGFDVMPRTISGRDQ